MPPAPRDSTRRLPLVAAQASAPSARPAWFDAIPSSLVDPAGRTITYARVSVTDRCDLACVYCMPPHGERDHAARAGMLDFDELARLASVLSRSGVARLRLTGGEPLVRRDVERLVARIAERAPALTLAMTSNGTRLATLASPLARAGLRSINVSVDSLDPARFEEITRGGSLEEVTRGLDAALAAGLEVKINTVVLGPRSLAEVPALVTWAWSLGVTPRFIELMPIGQAATLPAEAFVPIADVRRALVELATEEDPSTVGSRGPARYLRSARGAGRVGLIAASSEPFCASCNRIRITARGELRGCLGHPRGALLRDVMRTSSDDRDLAWALHDALRTKEAGHAFGVLGESAHADVGMSLVGG